MSNKNIETDVRIALDNASFENISEIMEDIDPAEFNLPEEISLGRIKKNAMSKINKKDKKSNKISIFKLSAGIVAAAALLFGFTLWFSTDVRAAVFGMFSFVPGVGMVEAEPNVENNTETADAISNNQVFDTNIYMLGNEGEKVVSDDIDIELVSLMIKDGKMDIEYFVDMKKIDISMFDEVFSQWEYVESEEYDQLFANVYLSLGYDKYFEINNDTSEQFEPVKAPHSAITIGGTEVKPEKSRALFSEVASFRYADIKETYDLSQFNIAENGECILSVADVSIPVKFENVKAYTSKEDAVGGRSVLNTGDGVEIMCDATLSDDGDLRVAIYSISTGDYEEIIDYDINVYADGHYIEGFVDGNYYVGDGEPATHYVYDASNYNKDTKFTYEIYGITAIGTMDNELSVQMEDADYGAHEINKEYQVNGETIKLNKYKLLGLSDALDAWDIGLDEYVCEFQGDCVDIRFDNGSYGFDVKPETLNDSNKRIMGFRKITLNGTGENAADFWVGPNGTYEIFTGKANGEVKSVEFSEPMYYEVVNIEQELVVK